MGEDSGNLISMSTRNKEGVMHVKTLACERLLNQRVDSKLQGNRVDNILSRIHVATPRGGVDPNRPPCIPQGTSSLTLCVFT